MHKLQVGYEERYVIPMVPLSSLFPTPYNCVPDAASGQRDEDAELYGFNLKTEVLRSLEGPYRRTQRHKITSQELEPFSRAF
jgi:hypothetical protein